MFNFDVLFLMTSVKTDPSLFGNIILPATE